MTFECEELVELCPRLETQLAQAFFIVSPVDQTVNQTAVVLGQGSVAQGASNAAGAVAVGG